MLKAKKDNKVYTIDEAHKDRYLSQGYDIYDGDKVVEYSPLKKVPYSEYRKIQEENEQLKARIAELEVPAETAKGKKAGA